MVAIVTQTTEQHGHVEGALQLSDWIDDTIKHESADIKAAGGLLIFHDWRSLGGYDSESRRLINERIKKRPPGYARRMHCVLQPSRLWRMALTVTDLTYAMLGIPPSVFTSDMSRAFAVLQGAVPQRAAPVWL